MRSSVAMIAASHCASSTKTGICIWDGLGEIGGTGLHPAIRLCYTLEIAMFLCQGVFSIEWASFWTRLIITYDCGMLCCEAAIGQISGNCRGSRFVHNQWRHCCN
mmetsp:Transcript_13391/g.30520  ORF Transcript_13391/g.30520 Transcript_13391/m.30520 type:complete len:105 (-) Transcript_13391:322-636(-)